MNSRKSLPFAILPLLLAAAGCTGGQGGVDQLFTTSSVAGSPTAVTAGGIAVTVPAADALVVPSAQAASIVEVSQTRYANGLSQKIVLAGTPGQSGENWIRVAITDGRKHSSQPHLLRLSAPTARNVASRLKSHFPGRAMAINAASHANAHGVFGTAHGVGINADGCHYGWQQLQHRVQSRTVSLGSLGIKPRAMRIEVRVCKSGMRAADFIDFMKRLSLRVPSDVLSRKEATVWAAAPAATVQASPDLVGAGFAASTPALPIAPVVIASAKAAPVVRPRKRRAAPVGVTATKPVRSVRPPTTPTTRPIPLPVLPAADTTTDSDEVDIRRSNRVAVAEADRFPTVPLPQ